MPKSKSLSELLKLYENHFSVLKIKAKYKIQNKSQFKEVSADEVRKIIQSLNMKKSAISSCIPVKHLTESVDIYLPFLKDIINQSLKNGIFPDELKLAKVIPLFKKADPFDKMNYRPVSLLSHISKIFERIIFNQTNEYIELFLSNLLPGFRKNYNTQHCLLKLLEKWKEALDKGNFVDAIFMDLSKAFNTLNHDLLIAKLEAFGLSLNSLRYIRSYSQRLQRTGVNNSFSLWKDVIAGVPQGSILGPLLCNIYINDIFLFVDTAFLRNYADDTTLYSIQNNPKSNQAIPNYNITTLQKWFYENYMVLNPSKCFYMC